MRKMRSIFVIIYRKEMIIDSFVFSFYPITIETEYYIANVFILSYKKID